MNTWMIEAIASNCNNEHIRLQCIDFLARNLTRLEYLKEQGSTLSSFMQALIGGRADLAWLKSDKNIENSLITKALKDFKIAPDEKLIEKVANKMMDYARTEAFSRPVECLKLLRETINEQRLQM